MHHRPSLLPIQPLYFSIRPDSSPFQSVYCNIFPKLNDSSLPPHQLLNLYAKSAKRMALIAENRRVADKANKIRNKRFTLSKRWSRRKLRNCLVACFSCL